MDGLTGMNWEYQATSINSQINSKQQHPNLKKDTNRSIGIWDFSHCDLFDIWLLGIVIYLLFSEMEIRIPGLRY
jgi:hypothetical protein